MALNPSNLHSFQNNLYFLFWTSSMSVSARSILGQLSAVKCRISAMRSSLTNLLCCYLDSSFVKLLATMLAVGTQRMAMRPALASCLSQRWQILTCLSLVSKLPSSVVSSPIALLLSHLIVIICDRSKPICPRSRLHYQRCFPASDSPNSSASVVGVITVRCFVAFQSTGPPQTQQIYPIELLRSSWSPYKASLTSCTDSMLPSNQALNSIARNLVVQRQLITRLATL